MSFNHPNRLIPALVFLLSFVVTTADAGAGVLRLRERLASLDPERPEIYFELAEEVAYEQPDDIELARTLYVLSFELARRRDPQTPLGASVCLALADLSTSADERRWLLSLGRSLTAGGGALTRIDEPDDGVGAGVALALAQALGDYRAGEYRRALDVIERKEIRPVFERLTATMPGGPDRILDELRSEPQCRRCRNKRIIRTGGDDGAVILCPTCGGDPGPDLTDDELIDFLRVESTLLGGSTTIWSAQLVLDRGRPLRDIDPDELAPWFRVDLEKPFWDESRGWVSQAERDEIQRQEHDPDAEPDAAPAGD